MKKLLIFATHPIQYQAPLFRLLAKEVNLVVVYGYLPKPKNQADAGFGVAFEWDIPLLEGYQFEVAELENPDTANTQTRNGLILKNPKAILKKHQPDAVVVHGWFPKAMVQMILACNQLKVPVWVRGDSNLEMKDSILKKTFKEVYFRWLFSKVTGFLYVGTLNKQLYKHYGVAEHKLISAPHSVDTNRFINEFSAVEQSKNKIFTVGFVGKFIEKKNPLELIQAVKLVQQTTPIKILWIGDGRLRNEIEKACSEANIPFEITGFLNQSELVTQGYSKLDVLVLPSAYNETWGLVVNEVYCGPIPAIVSNKVGCGVDLCASIHSKLVYESGNPTELANAIHYCTENFNSLKEKVSSASERFSIEETKKGYLTICSI